jgi:hypothetical protein
MSDIDSLPTDIKTCILAGKPSATCDQIMQNACSTSLNGTQYCACINSADACPFSTTTSCRNVLAYATGDMVNFAGKYGECKNYCSITNNIDGSNINAQITQSCGPMQTTNYYILFIVIIASIIGIMFLGRNEIIIPPPSVYGDRGLPSNYIIKI